MSLLCSHKKIAPGKNFHHFSRIVLSIIIFILFPLYLQAQDDFLIIAPQNSSSASESNIQNILEDAALPEDIFENHPKDTIYEASEERNSSDAGDIYDALMESAPEYTPPVPAPHKPLPQQNSRTYLPQQRHYAPRVGTSITLDKTLTSESREIILPEKSSEISQNPSAEELMESLAEETEITGEASASIKSSGEKPSEKTDEKFSEKNTEKPAEPQVSASRGRENELVLAIYQARPAVVNIRGEKVVKSSPYNPAEPGDEELQHVNGMGTGVIIDPRGYVITNYHVVDGVREIFVTTNTKKIYGAKVLARDKMTDLAIIKIDAVAGDGPFQTIRTGTSSDLMIGETVIAVGNAFGYEHTVTKGIVSALHRSVQVSDIQFYEDLIQTDASINPGNSGGPLLNIDGEMIGINVAVRAGAQGIGFAIPVDAAVQVITGLLSKQASTHHWTGLKVENKHEYAATDAGIMILDVEKNSPADEVGLRRGDILLSIGGEKIVSALDFAKNIVEREAGETLEMRVLRDGKKYKVSLPLGAAATGNQVVRRLNAPQRENEVKIIRRADIAVQEVSGEKTPSSAIWEQLGLELRPIPAKEFGPQHAQKYSGGLLVTNVRQGSMAEAQGIQPGDILLGILRWETLSLENVIYILNLAEYKDAGAVKFLLLRNSNVLYGHFVKER